MKLILTKLLSLTSLLSVAQCFTTNGIGDFEMADAATSYVVGTQGNGTIEVTTEEKYTGNQSLKADVTIAGGWEMRVFNTGTCYFDITPDDTYTISFYAKGDIGDIMNVSIMDNTTVDQDEDVSLTSTNWTLYSVSFKATATSSMGRVKLIFKDQGIYYLDDLQLNAFDCNNDAGGSANFDACGICSGGNTGLAEISDCSFQTIDPTNANLIFEGALESDISASKATLYRFKKSYATTGVSGFYSQSRAAASSGITLRFKTSSPSIKAYFQENLTIGDDIYWHTFDVYKNGVFQFDSQGWGIEMENPAQEMVEWEITFPTFSTVEFLKLEILNGFSLEPISKDKPVYVAIGNSITHGAGIDSFSTRKTYPHIIADSLDYELYNWGIGGSKVYDGVLDNFSTGLTPNLITVLWGYNDVHYSGHDSYLDATTFPKYETLLSTLAQDFPDACIMAILSTYTRTPENTPIRTIDSLRSGQLEILNDLQQTYSNINYMNGWDYTDDAGLNDDVHLNIHGNKDLAHGVIEELPCDIPTAQIGITQSNFKIYPNPTTGIINWGKNLDFEVLDISGKILSSGTGKSVNLFDFAKGIYFVKTQFGVSEVVLK